MPCFWKRYSSVMISSRSSRRARFRQMRAVMRRSALMLEKALPKRRRWYMIS